MTQSGGDAPLQGSGFLIRPDLIVTNAHVLGLETQKLELPASIEVVFDSGIQGKELAVLGEVAAVNMEHDLAYVRIQPLEKPRQPLELMPESELRETLPVFIVGFPFGDLLAAKDKNPSVTLGPGSISSLQKDEASQVDSLQLDGTLIPGCSGGPIVNSESQVAAISVSTLIGTQIGFGVPSARVARDLEGRPDQLTVRAIRSEEGTYRVSFELDAMDPLQIVSSAAVYVWHSPKPDPTSAPNAADLKTEVSKRTVKLQRDRSSRKWIGVVESFELLPEHWIWFQPAVAVGPKVRVGQPREYSASMIWLGDLELVVLPSNVSPKFNGLTGNYELSDTTHDAENVVSDSPRGKVDLFTPVPLPKLVPTPLPRPIVPKDRTTFQVEMRRDDRGKQIRSIVSKLEPIQPLRDFDGLLFPMYRQIAISPNGLWVFGISNTPTGDASVVDLHRRRVSSKIPLPSPGQSIWCDENRVAIVCQNEIVLVNAHTHEIVDIVHQYSDPKLKPLRIAGRAPDGSILTIWDYEGDDEFRYAFRLDEYGQLLLVTKFQGYTGLYCQRGSRFLYLQRNLEQNTLEAPGIIDISRQRSSILPSSISDFAVDQHWQSFRQSLDGNSFFVTVQPKHNNIGNAFVGKSYWIDESLSKQSNEFVGRIVGESLETDSSSGYVVTVGLLSDRPGYLRAAYMDKKTGEPLRWIDFQADSTSISSTNPDTLEPLPVGFVPGCEWLLWPNQSQLFVVACGPIDLPDEQVNAQRLAELPPSKAKVGTKLAFRPKLKDAQQFSNATYRLKRSIVGMTIDAATAQVELETYDFMQGDHLIEIEVLEGGKAKPFVKWTLTIEK